METISIKGKSNQVADALSRQSKDLPNTAEYANDLLQKALNKTFQTNAISTIIPGPSIVKQLEFEYAQDSEFSEIYKDPKNPFELQDHILFREKKILCPNRTIQIEPSP